MAHYKVPSSKTHNFLFICQKNMQRLGSVIRVKPEKLAEYKTLHAAAWPGVLKRIYESNIRNYSIYYRDGLLFSYMEYIGTDYKSDMDAIAADPITQQWWALTDPCQEPVPSAEKGDWWAPLEEVFHTD
jgi:L-rhamnose mutarotase